MTDVDELRASLSTWLTLARNAPPTDLDLLRLHTWIDSGLVGDMPEPEGPEDYDPTLADRTAMSIRVFWETKDWSASKFRSALVTERLRR